MDADRIIVLNDGRVMEQGSHEELMKLGGIYRRVYALQSGVAEELKEIESEEGGDA